MACHVKNGQPVIYAFDGDGQNRTLQEQPFPAFPQKSKMIATCY
jgi:hypothetical protein